MSETMISYSSLVSILLKEINKTRNNPKYFLPTLSQRLSKYDENSNNYYPIEDRQIVIQTQEGPIPVKQLMIQLNQMQVCPSLSWSYDLHCAAHERARNLSQMMINQSNQNHRQVQTQQIINKGNNQPDIDQLVNRYVEWKGSLSEHVFYGFIDPKQLLCEILIDDGNPRRQHRKDFFNPLSHFVGIGISEHIYYKFVVVIVYAGHIDKKKIFEIQPRYNPQSGCGDNCQIM